MENCFVTQLNGIADNPNLVKDGELLVHFPAANTLMYILFITTTTCEIKNGDATFYNGTTSLTCNAWYGYNPGVTDTCDMLVKNKYDLRSLKLFSSSIDDLSSLKYCTNLVDFISIYNDNTKGDIINLKNCPLSQLVILSTGIRGNFDDCDFTGLTTLKLSSMFTPSVEAISKNINLTELECFYVKGNIAQLAALTKLTSISINSIDGNVEGLLDGMVTNGRTTGTITVYVPTAKYNGSFLTNSKSFTFNSSGWHEA